MPKQNDPRGGADADLAVLEDLLIDVELGHDRAVLGPPRVMT